MVASDLRERFGSRVATLVLAVSEDGHIAGYARRKAALREQVARTGEEALMLFAADKLSKVRELHLGPTPARKSHSASAVVTGSLARRLTHYRHCLALLEDQLPDSPLVKQLRTELGAPGRRRRGHHDRRFASMRSRSDRCRSARGEIVETVGIEPTSVTA